MNISVAMAVYNGEKYIKEQISSILKQLGKDDEIIISYDKSNDNTYDIISSLAESDSRIKIFMGPCLGVIKNFENAFLNCNNDYIFLSDQDDIWLDNKVDTVLDTFKSKNVDVIIHDCSIVDENNNIMYPSFFSIRHCKPGFLFNIMHNSYIGCCMAVRRNFLQNILPFPENIPMHDQWLGLMAEKKGTVEFLNTALLRYRRHSNNASSFKHTGLFSIIKFRFNLIYALLKNK